MKSVKKIGRIHILCAACIAIAGMFAATGCDEESVIGAIAGGNTAGAAAGGLGDFNYTFTENRDDGTSNSFSFNPAISAHESLETYLGGSVVY